MSQRAVVLEWRITSRLGAYTIRYWIESDHDYGGVSRVEAARQIRNAEAAFTPIELSIGSVSICHRLLTAIPCANSIEVCDSDGFGSTVHRDWP